MTSRDDPDIDAPDTVWVGRSNGRSRNRYHLDRECKRGRGDLRPFDHDVAESWGLSPCKYCSGTLADPSGMWDGGECPLCGDDIKRLPDHLPQCENAGTPAIPDGGRE